MTFWLIIIFFGVFQGGFLLMFLLSKRIFENSQQHVAILLILAITLLTADYALSNYYILYKDQAFFGIGWSSSLWLVVAPLYYLLFQSFLTNVVLTLKNTIVHLTPFIASLVFNTPFFILPAEVRQEYLLSYSLGREITLLHIILKAIYHLQLLLYPALILKVLLRIKVSPLNFVTIINLSLIAVGVGSFIHLMSFNFFHLSISWFTSTIIFVCLTFFIHVTVFLLMARPDWFLIQVNEVVAKYTISNLSNIDVDKVQNDLKLLMEQQQVFLQRDLSLTKLSDFLQISPHKLSEFLNQKKTQTFSDYVNSYRIKEAKKILLSSEYKVLTIEAIAHKVGFNSTATFYRSFKKQTGVSPTEWLKTQM